MFEDQEAVADKSRSRYGTDIKAFLPELSEPPDRRHKDRAKTSQAKKE